MKKRRTVITLLLTLCLAFAGCAQNVSNTEAPGIPASESHNSGIGAPDQTKPDPGVKPGDEYSLTVRQVKFEENVPYNTIYYIYAPGSEHSTHVSFVRNDFMHRDGDSHLTYYVNSSLNGKTISRDMAIVFCYLLENIKADSDQNPLEPIYHTNGPYNV